MRIFHVLIYTTLAQEYDYFYDEDYDDYDAIGNKKKNKKHSTFQDTYELRNGYG